MSILTETEPQRFRLRLQWLGLLPQEIDLAVQVFHKECLESEFYSTEELWMRDRVWQLWAMLVDQYELTS